MRIRLALGGSKSPLRGYALPMVCFHRLKKVISYAATHYSMVCFHRLKKVISLAARRGVGEKSSPV
jgi:hypothetical protein